MHPHGGAHVTSRRHDGTPRVKRRDEGSTLVLVLVLMLISALIVVPLINYTMTVSRAAQVEVNKARSVQLARGGFWVALSYQEALYDMCNGGSLPSSLSTVTTTCTVLRTDTLRPIEKVPAHIAVVQGDIGDGTGAVVPAAIATGGSYVNPNTPSDESAWLATPDWTTASTANKVWLPELPVQSTSGGGTRDTTMLPGTQDPLYASCRVFFPGTFTTPITIDEPTYFASGVYYFTEPITLENGADVAVGNGAAGGCTTDFEAVASATSVPDPLNMSGLGGTFVFGENARLVIDDTVAAGDIRFAMNQRYVSTEEASVIASSNVSIISVNGNHAPFDPADPTDVLGVDLNVDGVIAVPLSRVDDPIDDPHDPTDDPLATDAGYLPSAHTPKPIPPDWDGLAAPTATPLRTGSGTYDAAATITWPAANANGSMITSYTVTGTWTGVGNNPGPGPFTCSPAVPTLPDTSIQPSCTITGLRHRSKFTFDVVATNAYGDSAAATSNPIRARVVPNGTGTIPADPLIVAPAAPVNMAVGNVYSDGLEITWDPVLPPDDGNSPVTTYVVTATPAATPLDPSDDVSCPPVWWDETSCVLPLTDTVLPLPVDDFYLISMVAAKPDPLGGILLSPVVELDGDPGDGGIPPEPDPYLYEAGVGPSPVQVADVPNVRIPDPIVDLAMYSTNEVSVTIAGYVAVPQGHVRIDAANPANKTVRMSGGLVAAQIRLGTHPASLQVTFDNPIAQKTVRLRSTASDRYTAVADAVVKVNRSGSIAVNSLVVQ